LELDLRSGNEEGEEAADKNKLTLKESDPSMESLDFNVPQSNRDEKPV
jgi:hypothetical protein